MAENNDNLGDDLKTRLVNLQMMQKKRRVILQIAQKMQLTI